MKKDGLLCWNCRKVVPYSVHCRNKVRTIGNKDYEYQECFGTCDICHEEITVPGLSDENERILDLIYRSDINLITIDEINEILHRYNVEKRPLSHILGLGEHTISRYVEGALPNRKNSDFLRDVLRDPHLMRKHLEDNKNNITENAYHKVDSALSEIESLCNHESKTELFALYIIHKADEVTDLFLQKLLYYVKAFSWLFLERDMIEDNCEAWTYGPVFPDIYVKYKLFGNRTIPDYDQSINYDSILGKDEKMVLDYVIHCFGIYNGGVLMRLTHKETPWQTARTGIPDYAPSSNLIENTDIRKYFEKMDKKYHLKQMDGVKAYIYDLIYV